MATPQDFKNKLREMPKEEQLKLLREKLNDSAREKAFQAAQSELIQFVMSIMTKYQLTLAETLLMLAAGIHSFSYMDLQTELEGLEIIKKSLEKDGGCGILSLLD